MEYDEQLMNNFEIIKTNIDDFIFDDKNFNFPIEL